MDMWGYLLLKPNYMETDLQSNDREFLEQALKFYRNVHTYSSLLEIDANELAAFKNDIRVFLFIADKRYRSFTDGFIQYNIMILRNKLEHLFIACSCSKYYTKKIGEDLGMITPQHHVSWPLGWADKDISLDWLVNAEV